MTGRMDVRRQDVTRLFGARVRSRPQGRGVAQVKFVWSMDVPVKRRFAAVNGTTRVCRRLSSRSSRRSEQEAEARVRCGSLESWSNESSVPRR